jgi:hypothetical protein
MLTLQFKAQKILDQQGIKYYSNYITKYAHYDLYLPETKQVFNFLHPAQQVTNNPAMVRKPSTHLIQQAQIARSQHFTLFNFWANWDENIALALFKAKLGLSDKTIYARKCVVKRVTNKDVKEFFDTYHLHGNAPATFYFALYNEDEIVAAMTFRNTRNKGECECARLAIKSGLTILGGTHKLFKFAEKTIRESNKYSSIVSFAYRDLTPDPEHSVYSRLGFDFIEYTVPSLFFYMSKPFTTPNGTYLPTGVYSRQKFQTHKLYRDFGLVDFHAGDLKSIGLYHLYDSGNLKFKYLL